jgi:hypothetical protein
MASAAVEAALWAPGRPGLCWALLADSTLVVVDLFRSMKVRGAHARWLTHSLTH